VFPIRRGGVARPARLSDGGNAMNIHNPIIQWSEDSRVFVAEIPELPGCFAHGDTEESALRNVQDAAQLWIDTAREFCDPIPK
jgi:predicted RNase H-like HicB family nuclease